MFKILWISYKLWNWDIPCKESDLQFLLKNLRSLAIWHKKEWNNAICSNMDGRGDYHTKWRKSDRERQIPYDTTYTWNLRWYKWTCLQNRNRLTDLGNKLTVTKGERWGGYKLGVLDWHIHTATAAAAAKSLQSCPTLYDPMDSSPPGSPVPGILQARTLEWVHIHTTICKIDQQQRPSV